MISKLPEDNYYQRVWAEIDSECHLGEYDPYEGKYCPGDEDTGGHKDGRLRTRRCSHCQNAGGCGFYVWLCAATYEEAHVLREASVKKLILILDILFPDRYEELIRRRSARQSIAGIRWKSRQKQRQRPERRQRFTSRWIPACRENRHHSG